MHEHGIEDTTQIMDLKNNSFHIEFGRTTSIR